MFTYVPSFFLFPSEKRAGGSGAGERITRPEFLTLSGSGLIGASAGGKPQGLSRAWWWKYSSTSLQSIPTKHHCTSWYFALCLDPLRKLIENSPSNNQRRGPTLGGAGGARVSEGGAGGQRLAEISVAASTVSTAGGRAGGNTAAVSGASRGTCEFGERRPGVAGRDTRLLSGRPSCLAHDKSIRGGRVPAHEPRVLFKKSSLR